MQKLAMILKSEIKRVYEEQLRQLENANTGIKRQLIRNIRLDTDFVLIITGIRRCGKSTLQKQLIKNSLPGFRYLNFEDPRLSGFTLNDMVKLDDLFLSGNENPWLVFDEIQVVEGWEKYVRAKQDEGRRMLISGSNASLLSRELGTRLTGRHLSYELFPFSYAEYLIMMKEKPGAVTLGKYVKAGGFPEYLKYAEDDILFRIGDDILYRDIAVRQGIRQPELLRKMLIYLITNSGKLFSYNNLRKLFSLGSANTVKDYISFFEDSYLLFTLPKFSFSPKKQMANPRKVYTIDTGLARVNSLSFSDDAGRKLENLVFLELRRRYRQIYYHSGDYECDFLAGNAGQPELAIQVCHELHPDNIDRELEGLAEAMSENNIETGLIITFDQEDRLEKNGTTVDVMPAWSFLDSRINPAPIT